MSNQTEKLWEALEADIRSGYYFNDEQLLRRLAEIKASQNLRGPSDYCCGAMKDQLTYECDQHPDQTCPDIIITRSDTFPVGPSTGPIVDVKISPHYTLWGRNAEYFCQFCPWCGTDLGYQAYEKDVEALFEGE